MNIKILLVDDDENLREVIKDVLNMYGYEVVCAEDGNVALELFKEENFDLIITDLRMRTLNGIDLVKAIKGKYQDVPPVILMTGYGSVESAIEAFKIGIKDYILKPFKITTLKNVIEKVLKQANLERENLQLKEVVSLYTASERINNSIYIEKVGKSLVECMQDLSKASAVVLYLKDEDLNVLKTREDFFKVSPKFEPKREELFKSLNKELTMKEVEKTIANRKYTILFKKIPLFEGIDPLQTVIYRLQTATRFIGILILFSLSKNIIFPEEKIKAYKIIIDESSIAIENALLFKKHQEMFFQTLNSLALTIDAKDRYTHGHSIKVTKYAEIIAKTMNLSEDQRKNIIEGGLLHDIGKIGIPDNILFKPSKLNEIEYQIIKTHPTIGKNILEPLKKNFGKVIDIVYYHHERYDGKGYPAGLKGEEIPMEVRIVTVADSFDAMTSDRAYRKGMPMEKAVDELKRNKGTQFDPEAVEAFMSSYSEIEKYLNTKPENIEFKI